MKIKNPEKECKTTPENFSAESKITNVETVDFRRGIILESPAELARALIVYSGGSVKKARATQNNLIDAVGNKGGGMGAALLLLGKANANDFTKKLTKEALSELQTNGKFYKSFDYDAMGTNFFKTSVNGKKVGDKYVLELYAAYVGSAPENELAEKLGKPMALIHSSLEERLSVVDDWWFNVNLENVLAGLPISKEQLKSLPEYIVSRESSGKSSEITFEHQGQNFSFNVCLDAKTYLIKPEGGDSRSRYLQARGKFIVGGAWTIFSEDDKKIIPPTINPSALPAVMVSVSLLDERYSRQVAVTEDQMKAVQSARDYLADLIRTK